MRSRSRISPAMPLALLAFLAGCDAVDSARSRLSLPDTDAAHGSGSGLALALHAPGLLEPGDEGSLRVALTNQTDTVVSHVRLELIVPHWAEPLPPRPGDREVSMTPMEDGGIRFAYRMEETPLDPGGTQTVEQRIRVAAAGSGNLPDGAVPWSRTVRARLLGPGGQPLAEVESEIAVAGLPDDTTAGAGGSAARPHRDRLGPVRLGMTPAELRQTVTGARDTTWSQEGMPQSGIVVPLDGQGRAVATLDGETVTRIVVTDPMVRTAEGLGVGSRLEELRAAYGPTCADAAEGRVVVWFAGAPGISFALDAPVPANVAQLRANPEQIPVGARVTRWWLRSGDPGCPAGPA